MRHKLIFLIVFILFALGGTALADTFYLTVAGGPSGNNLGGAYVAPYAGSLSPGTPLGIGTLTVICDDYNHDVSVPENWPVVVTQFSTSSGALSNTRFGSGVGSINGVQLYEDVFYLIEQMNFSSSPSPATLLQNAELQWAIWALTTPMINSALNTAIGLTDASAVENFVTVAENNSSGQNYNNFYIITPTGTIGQEYITEVPEPASIALCAGGLSALFLRRKRS